MKLKSTNRFRVAYSQLRPSQKKIFNSEIRSILNGENTGVHGNEEFEPFMYYRYEDDYCRNLLVYTTNGNTLILTSLDAISIKIDKN